MYQSLQAGRAIAAALVVAFHLGGTFAQDKYFGFKGFDALFAWGDSGVEYFFVLSGFLITIAHRRDFGQPNAFRGYVAKRVLRIYPTYWLVCLAVCAAALAAPALKQALPNDLPTLLMALALIPQDPAVVGGTGAPILFVAWSLQYEMFFYGVVGLAVLQRGVGFCMAFALLVLPAACAVGSCSNFPASFFGNNLILLFGLGVAGAYFVRSRATLPNPLAIGVAGVFAFVGFGLFETWYGRDALAVDRRLVFGVFSAVIIVALARAENDRTLRLHSRWVTILGDSSYALYLLHIPVISLMVKLLVRAGVSTMPAMVAAFLGVFASCVAVAVLFHLTIERRMLAALRPFIGPPAAVPSRTGPATGAIGAQSPRASEHGL